MGRGRSFLVNAVDLKTLGVTASGSTTIDLVAGDSFRAPTPPFYAVINPFDPVLREYIYVEGVNTTTNRLTTVSRQIEGETPQSQPDGSTVRISYVAQILDDLNDDIEARVIKAGDTMTGALILPGLDPVLDNEAVRKAYVDLQARAGATLWRYDSNTADADPGTGNYRRNIADPTLTTFLYLSNLTNLGIDLSPVYEALPANTFLFLAAYDGNQELYKTTGEVIDATTYTKIPVEYVDSTASDITTGVDVRIGGLTENTEHFHDELYVQKAGDSMSGELTMGGNKVRQIGDALSGTDALNQQSGDARYSGISHASAHASGGADALVHGDLGSVGIDDHHARDHKNRHHAIGADPIDIGLVAAPTNPVPGFPPVDATDLATKQYVDDNAGATNHEQTRATMTANQSLPNNSFENVLFNDEDFDDGGRHNPVTANDRITLPAGDWELIGQIAFAASATGKREVELWEENTIRVATAKQDAPATGEMTLTVNSGPIRLTGTTWFRLKAFQTSGGALDIVAAGCWFTAKRLD